MHQNADKIIMLIDSSKLGVRSLIQVMSLEEVDILVTDPDSPIDIVDELRQRGIEVHIVEIAGQLSG
jgi:DeoR/GlpR family transcriptional regulator of sugar metabolism